MKIVNFGGIPKDVLGNLLKRKKNPEIFKPTIFGNDIYEIDGAEVVYNKLMFKCQIGSENGGEVAKIDKIFDLFLSKNPEAFFNELKLDTQKNNKSLQGFVKRNEDRIASSREAYFRNTIPTYNKAESALKAVQTFFRPSSTVVFDQFNRGVPLGDETKRILRENLMTIIGTFGADIQKNASGSVTTFFIMENPTTQKGKEYKVTFVNMPKNLQKQFNFDSYVYCDIKDTVLKQGEGKKYKSKLYEEKDMDKEIENLEEVLDLQQRRQRSRTMKRFSKKIAMARKRTSRRMADASHIEGRARRAAVQILRKRFAGSIGVNYKELSVSQKMTVDKRVEAKKDLIGKIAKRLVPKMRAKEVARLSNKSKAPA